MFSRSAHNLISFAVLSSLLAACALVPTPIKMQPSTQNALANAQIRQASTLTETNEPQTLTFPSKVTPQTLEQTESIPNTTSEQTFSMDFVTATPTAQQIKMPLNGSFKVIYQAGPGFQIIDNDATDGTARIQLPSQNFDIYLRPEAQTTSPASCPTPTPTNATANQIFDQLDQAVLDKANQLNSAGQSQCTYIPPSNQRQNSNCNSTSTGFQCSGALNKTISVASCPEIAIYGGAMNLNHALAASKLWVAMQNNLTLNQSVRGIFSSRGDLNTSLNNSAQLNGVFVGARSNLNLGGNAKLQGLYAILNNGNLSMNLNPSAIVEGQICSTGSGNINRNGNSQLIYNPNQITTWQSDLPMVSNLMCNPGNKPYTQTIAQTCSTPIPSANGSLKVEDKLYYVDQTLSPTANGQWYKLAGRPMPIPTDWRSEGGNEYTLNFNNSGIHQIKSHWTQAQQKTFPVGIKEIGPEGGTIDYPGIGKLILPEGALSQVTTIVMKQVFNAKELLAHDLETGQTFVSEDYISPIVGIEPLGLALNKPAELFLETDTTRLGQNSPGFISWGTTQVAPIKNYYHLDTKSDGVPLNSWSHNMPTLINKFGFFFKLIPRSVAADGETELKIMSPNNLPQDFTIQSQNSQIKFLIFCSPAVMTNSNNINTSSKCLPEDKLKADAKAQNVVNQLGSAYLKYMSITKHLPPFWHDGAIPLQFVPGTSVGIFISNEKEGSSWIRIGVEPQEHDVIPHEMWHVFQLARFNQADAKFAYTYSKWLFEAAATFAGGYLTENYPSEFKLVSNRNSLSYLSALNLSHRYINTSFIEYRPEGQVNTTGMPIDPLASPKQYNASAFFTYLSHPLTGLNEKIENFNVIKNKDPKLAHLSLIADLADSFNDIKDKQNDADLDVKILNERMSVANKNNKNNWLSTYYLNHIPHSFKGGRYSSNHFVFSESNHLLKDYMKQNFTLMPEDKPLIAFGNNSSQADFLPCLSSSVSRILAPYGRQLWKSSTETPLIIYSGVNPKIGYFKTHIFYELPGGTIIEDYLPKKHVLKTTVPDNVIAINIVNSNAEWRPCKKKKEYPNNDLRKHEVLTALYYAQPLKIKESRRANKEEEQAVNVPIGTHIVLKTTGVEPNDNVIFESRSNGTIMVEPIHISNADPTTGEQDVLVEYPQEAKEHGWVQIVTEDDESNRLDDVAFPCSSLVAGNNTFDIASDRQSPCGKK